MLHNTTDDSEMGTKASELRMVSSSHQVDTPWDCSNQPNNSTPQMSCTFQLYSRLTGRLIACTARGFRMLPPPHKSYRDRGKLNSLGVWDIHTLAHLVKVHRVAGERGHLGSPVLQTSISTSADQEGATLNHCSHTRRGWSYNEHSSLSADSSWACVCCRLPSAFLFASETSCENPRFHDQQKLKCSSSVPLQQNGSAT